MNVDLSLIRPYAPLVRRIEAEATVIGDQILKIDHFLNHRSTQPCCAPAHASPITDLSYFIGAGLLPPERRTHERELVAV